VYACTLVDELQRLGLRVPRDVSVMGMDDMLAARLSSPQLSTYRFPMEELGRSATELLIERIKDRSRPVRHLQINGQIIERASCARPAQP
jgi:LacI family transcriptional regulator